MKLSPRRRLDTLAPTETFRMVDPRVTHADPADVFMMLTPGPYTRVGATIRVVSLCSGSVVNLPFDSLVEHIGKAKL